MDTPPLQNVPRDAKEHIGNKIESFRYKAKLTYRKGSRFARDLFGASLNKTSGSIYGFTNTGALQSHRKRALFYRGLQEMYGTRSRLYAAAKYEAAIKTNKLTQTELNRIQNQIWHKMYKADQGKEPLDLATKEIQKLKNIKPRKRDIVTGLMKYSLAGTGRIAKPHSHAILNPRVLGAAALGVGAVSALAFANRKGEALRTMHTGSGRFGKDSAGMLGPAALEGMRFKSHKRRIRI